MGRTIVSFAAVILTALALVPGGAHLLELAHKLRLDHDDYLKVQTLYLGWAFSGVVIIAALALNLGQAWVLRTERAGRSLSLAAAGLIALSLVVFFAFTFPVNQTTQNWSTGGGDWRALRARWEYSHAVDAAITFAALCCSALAAILRR